MAKLAVTHQAHTKRNQAIAQQLAELLSHFDQQQLEVIVLKGALLAPTVYPEAGLRPMNDIDLLFRPEDLGRVASIFESLGYSGKHRSADQGPGVTKHLSTYRRAGNEGATPNPYLSPGGDRMVEPHLSLEESWFGLKVDITPGVWDRAVPISLAEQRAYRLATTDLVIHLALHATFHLIMGATVFVQLYDIGRVLTLWSEEVDWSEILNLSRRHRAEAFVYAALFWARRLYGAPVPEGPLRRLQECCAPKLAAHIHRLDGPAILARTQQPPLVNLGQRLRRGLADRRETARWVSTTAGKWRVWQTALAFHKTDTINLLHKRLKAQA
jgi:hypothetical protein